MCGGKDSNFTRDYIKAGQKITENELMRQKFIMELPTPSWPSNRLSAADNLLADILADPEQAGTLWHFFPSIFGLNPPDAPDSIFIPDDISPWGHRPAAGHCFSDPLEKNPNEDVSLLKDFAGRSTALLAGAAITGVAPMDENHLYTHSLDGIPIELAERKDFSLGPELISLPRKADRILVLGFVRTPEIMGMNPGLAKLKPSQGWLNWPEQIAAVLKLADWISAQGYLALPSAGGILMAGHHGVMAGLGELGRQGLLISPEYGPNLRLFTIITDYPFIPGRPAIFGVADYCETCQRCINECPAKALTEGRRQPGLFQWPVNHRLCFDNWLEKKDPCRKCIEVCPYTREPLIGSPGGAQRPAPVSA